MLWEAQSLSAEPTIEALFVQDKKDSLHEAFTQRVLGREMYFRDCEPRQLESRLRTSRSQPTQLRRTMLSPVSRNETQGEGANVQVRLPSYSGFEWLTMFHRALHK
jgi:hypothetical protein